MYDFLKFMDGLPCAKRTFGIILGLGLLCSFLIYDFNSRNSYLVKIASKTTLSNFSERRLWESRARESSGARSSQLGKQTPPRRSNALKSHRIQGKHGSNDTKDIVSFDKRRSPLHGTSSSIRVDSTDKARVNSNQDHDFITEEDSNTDGSILKQEDSTGPTAINSDKDFVKRLPNAIIIGVKKGGTRALLEILKIHPNVRACNSEVHFFDRDKNYERGLSWYTSRMPPSFPGEITIEKSPAYFVTSKVPQRVYNMSQSVKLLVVVRDPTRRAISDYTQSLEKKPDNYPFETFAVKDLERGIVNVKWMKLRIGLYAEYLKKWLQFFPLKQIHFVSGEQLIKNPAKELRRLEKFLKLTPFITEDNFVFNETKGFYCLVGKRTRGQTEKSKPRCMGKSKGRTHPAIRGPVIKLLNRYFRPHNIQFYKMANREFGWP